MTTIVWDGKTLATDSRETAGSCITSDNVEKLIRLDPHKHRIDGIPVLAMGCAGSSGTARLVKALMESDNDLGLTPLTEVPQSCEIISLVIDINGQGWWMMSDTESTLVLLEPVKFEAIGSGSNFARSAMLMGLDAIQAVEHACKLDIYSGGKVQHFTYIEVEQPRNTQ